MLKVTMDCQKMSKFDKSGQKLMTMAKRSQMLLILTKLDKTWKRLSKDQKVFNG